MEKIFRSEDKEFLFTYTDINGSAVALSQFSGIAIVLTDIGGAVMNKYNNPAKVGFDSITISGNTALIRLQSDVTTTAKLGVIQDETKFQQVNTNFDDNREHTVSRSAGDLAEVVDSTTKNLTNLA